jgi:hypothetical protein
VTFSKDKVIGTPTVVPAHDYNDKAARFSVNIPFTVTADVTQISVTGNRGSARTDAVVGFAERPATGWKNTFAITARPTVSKVGQFIFTFRVDNPKAAY